MYQSPFSANSAYFNQPCQPCQPSQQPAGGYPCFCLQPCQPCGQSSEPVQSKPSSETLVEYYPYERTVIEYQQKQRVQKVPVEKIITEYEVVKKKVKKPVERMVKDYYVVQTVTDFKVEYQQEQKIEYVDRKIEDRRYEYVPVESKNIHYPEGVSREYIDSIMLSGVKPISQEAFRRSRVTHTSSPIHQVPYPQASPNRTDFGLNSIQPLRQSVNVPPLNLGLNAIQNISSHLIPPTVLTGQVRTPQRQFKRQDFPTGDRSGSGRGSQSPLRSNSILSGRMSLIRKDTKDISQKYDFTSSQNRFTAIFQNQQSNKVMAIQEGKRAQGLEASLEKGEGSQHQRWRLKKIKDSYEIQNILSKLVLEPSGVTQGSTIVQKYAEGRDNQLWLFQIINQKSGLIRFKRNPNLVIGVNSKGEGVQLQRQKEGASGQLWQLHGVSA